MKPACFPMEAMEKIIETAEPIRSVGKITEVVGLVLQSKGPITSVGDTCLVGSNPGAAPLLAEVIGFRDERVLLMPFGDVTTVPIGASVTALGAGPNVPVGHDLLGRVVDGLGRPIDGKGAIVTETTRPLTGQPPTPMSRRRIESPLPTGIRAIDSMLTIGRGQRMGIFAGSGVGKSTLLGMIARNCSADLNVIALIGERGREVREFIERDLGPDGLARSVVVAVTSDQAALLRAKGASLATAIAEHFRDSGLDVMLMMDSVTRVAMAQREIGLAAGEPPATRGYPPSVFGYLPRLLERSGTSARGSITGIYTVLVEGDDMNEPVADTVRSILDGHIRLSRRLASQNHHPSIDIQGSVSRVMTDVVSEEHVAAAAAVRELLAVYADAEDLVNIGAYVNGSNPRIDAALRSIDKVRDFLRQTTSCNVSYEESEEQLRTLLPSPEGS